MNNEEKLLAYAYRLLARQAYSEAHVRDRLKRRAQKINPAGAAEEHVKMVEKIVQRLKGLKYVDDALFVKNYCEYALKRNPLGRFGFLSAMKRKGIDPLIAQKAWRGAKIDENEIAFDLAQRRLRLMPKSASAFEKKKKIAAFLARRGFNPDVIWEVVENLCARTPFS